jgi:hypothetical protein
MSITGHYSVFIENNKEIHGNYNKIFGSNNKIHGHYNVITGDNNEVHGNHNKDIKGNNNKVYGHYNTIIGENNNTIGNHNDIKGNNNQPVQVYGHYNQIIGNLNDIQGNYNNVHGNHSKIVGHYNEITGDNNSIKGNNNKQRGSYNIVNIDNTASQSEIAIVSGSSSNTSRRNIISINNMNIEVDPQNQCFSYFSRDANNNAISLGNIFNNSISNRNTNSSNIRTYHENPITGPFIVDEAALISDKLFSEVLGLECNGNNNIINGSSNQNIILSNNIEKDKKEKNVDQQSLENENKDNENDENKKDNDETKCVVCIDKKKNILIIGCNHCCLCESCVKNIKTCPLCRQKIEKTMKIFI